QGAIVQPRIVAAGSGTVDVCARGGRGTDEQCGRTGAASSAAVAQGLFWHAKRRWLALCGTHVDGHRHLQTTGSPSALLFDRVVGSSLGWYPTASFTADPLSLYPQRISYDNLTTAVRPIFTGRTRQEQRACTAFRSYYLFDSHFCNLDAGHEKGQVEHGVGYVRRNALVPVPSFASFAALNAYLLSW